MPDPNLWGGVPFAEYAHHRCCGCRYHDGRWGASVCSLHESKGYRCQETNSGLNCPQWSGLPWVRRAASLLPGEGNA